MVTSGIGDASQASSFARNTADGINIKGDANVINTENDSWAISARIGLENSSGTGEGFVGGSGLESGAGFGGSFSQSTNSASGVVISGDTNRVNADFDNWIITAAIDGETKGNAAGIGIGGIAGGRCLIVVSVSVETSIRHKILLLASVFPVTITKSLPKQIAGILMQLSRMTI